MDKRIFDKIIESNNIVNYLEEKGIYPSRKSGDKLFYLCPLPGHPNDTSPSFVVYEKNDGTQTYHCFGCGSKWNIINLVSEIDGISKKEAFIKLANRTNLDGIDSIGCRIEEIQNLDFFIDDFSNNYSGIDDARDSIYLSINFSIRMHFEMVDFDPDEIYFFEKNICVLVDKAARQMKNETLREMYDVISEKWIPMRYRMYLNAKEKSYCSKWI